MNSTQSEAFFFISSIGFIFLWVVLAILLFYLIKAIRTFSRVMEKVESDVDKISDVTKEVIEDIKESAVFRLLVPKRRRRIK